MYEMVDAVIDLIPSPPKGKCQVQSEYSAHSVRGKTSTHLICICTDIYNNNEWVFFIMVLLLVHEAYYNVIHVWEDPYIRRYFGKYLSKLFFALIQIQCISPKHYCISAAHGTEH